MEIITPELTEPQVNSANYIGVTAQSSWGPRMINDFELVYIVAGCYGYRTIGNNKEVSVSPGQLLCIHPGEKHIFYRNDQYAYRGIISCIHFEPLRTETMMQTNSYQLSPCPPLITDLRDNETFHSLFKKIAASYNSSSIFHCEITRTIMKELWLRLGEYWLGDKQTHNISARLNRMLLFLQGHMSEPVGRNDLAAKFNISPEHVNSIFKRELGETPTQYLHKIRAKEAYLLLIEGRHSVKEVAQVVGFDNEFYFSRIFKRVMGFPPSESINHV